MNAQPSNFDLAPVETVSQGVNQFVTFSAGENAYGIDIMSVRVDPQLVPDHAPPRTAVWRQRGARYPRQRGGGL